MNKVSIPEGCTTIHIYGKPFYVAIHLKLAVINII